jgi:hypothetical protein
LVKFRCEEEFVKKLLTRVARQSPALIVAMLALFVALTGTAVATTSALITGKSIKNGSITGLDIKNKSVTAADIKGQLRGPQGLTGAQGAQGAKGDKGDKGDKGEQGRRWFVAPELRRLVCHEAGIDHRLLLRRLQTRRQRLRVDGDLVELQRGWRYGRDHDLRVSV